MVQAAPELPPATSGHRLIWIGIATFVAAVVLLFGIGFCLGPATGESTPRYPVSETVQPLADGVGQITLDVSDEKTAVPFSLRTATRVEASEADLVVRRYVLQAPHGALDLGALPITEAQSPASPQWVADTTLRGELQNPALAGWYDYSYWTHVLSSRQHSYAVHLADGGVALIAIRSYYCAPEGSGCLTLQYRLLH